MAEELDKEKLLEQYTSFADKHLAPYELKNKPGGATEIIPYLCPFCHGGDSGKDMRTFALSVDFGVYVCKRGSCGKRGKFDDLASYFNDETTVTVKKKKKNQKKSQFDLPTTVVNDPTEEIYSFFEKRGISKETVDAFKIGSDSHGNIVFRFYWNDENVFEKFRKPKKYDGNGPKEWRMPNTKAILYNMDSCTFAKPLVICEGQIDAMALYEAGVQNVVSVPSGCEDTSWIDYCWEWLDKFQTFVLFGDSDEPGRRMVREVSKRIDETKCLIVKDYPKRPDGKECKDANEVLYFCGGMKLIEMVENAEEIPVKGLIDLADVQPDDPANLPAIKTGIPDLDDALYGFELPGTTVISGQTGAGKSTISGVLILQAIEQGYSVCAYSGELSKRQFRRWIDAQAAGSEYITLKYSKIKGRDVPYVPFEVTKRLTNYYRGKLILCDNDELSKEEGKRMDAIFKMFTMAARRNGCRLFLVDNMMTVTSDCGDDKLQAQARFMNKAIDFAKRMDAHVIIICHPRKLQGRQMEVFDISGNSDIGNLASNVIEVAKPHIRILKGREEGSGGREIECEYAPDSRRIYQHDCGDLNKFSWNSDGLAPLPKDKRATWFDCYKPMYRPLNRNNEPI